MIIARCAPRLVRKSAYESTLSEHADRRADPAKIACRFGDESAV
jgi:hypothetical protein